MTKFLTFRSLLALSLFVVGVQASIAQTAFWQETFSNQGSATTQWISGGTNAGATPQVWTWTNDPGAGFQTPTNQVPPFAATTAADGYFYFNSDANGDGAHDVTLTGVGNPANCTGKGNVHLRFSTQYIHYTAGAQVQVGVSTDGQNFTYQSVLTGIPVDNLYEGSVEIDLDAANNAAQVWLQFRWVGNYEYHLKIDDVQLYDLPLGPIPCDQNPSSIICDNFESYNVGNISPQSPHWIPWDLNEASAVGAEVSTEQASQGTKSMKCRLQGAGDDQLLQLGNKSAGRYSLKWKMFIPTGRAAYINVQTDQNAPGASNANFSFQLYFLTNGSLIQDIPGPADTIANGFPHGQWFQFESVFDLDNNTARVLVDGNLVKSWIYPQTLGAIDFFCADNTYLFYVDEVEYVQLPAPNPDNCPNAFDISPYFGATLGVAQTTGLFDNTNASVSATDPGTDGLCFIDLEDGANAAPKLDKTMWFNFVGDGEQYHIETVPCNSTNYIGSGQDDIGDTQMAIYSGNCGDLTLAACADDLFADGDPDWRAGLDLQTTAGTNYLMMIDGFNFGGTVAQGEFCIEITRGQAVSCAEGQVGSYTVTNQGNLCFDQNLANLITLDGNFILPTSGPVAGMSWALSSAELDPSIWPVDDPSYLNSTGVLPQVFSVGLANDGSFPNGIYYITPVVVGGGVDPSPANGPFLNDLDISNGCFYVGQSYPITVLPELDELFATFTTTNASVPPGNNGVITLTPEGGFPGLVGDPALYVYTWSNGATTQNLTGVAGGTYTVEIADPTGCVDPISITISLATPTTDPKSVKMLSLSPNPTSGMIQVNLQLSSSEEVNYEVSNAYGQSVMRANAGNTSSVKQELDFSSLPTGTYFLRVTIGKETAVRRISVQR